MNKIVLRLGLLTFALAVFYYSESGYPVEDIIVKSFFLFVLVTVLTSIVALVVIKTINKNSIKKTDEL